MFSCWKENPDPIKQLGCAGRDHGQPEQPQEGGGGEGVLVIPYKMVGNTRCTFNPLIPKGVQPIVSPHSSST